MKNLFLFCPVFMVNNNVNACNQNTYNYLEPFEMEVELDNIYKI